MKEDFMETIFNYICIICLSISIVAGVIVVIISTIGLIKMFFDK